MMEYPCPLYMQKLSLLTEALRAGFGHLAVCVPHKVGILKGPWDFCGSVSHCDSQKVPRYLGARVRRRVSRGVG
jgi:hypothetical protein